MKLHIDYHNENEIRRVWSWLTRIGAGRKFGSLPIGWYQKHQSKAHEILMGLCSSKQPEVRCKDGVIQERTGAGWNNIISAKELFDQADSVTRI